MTIMIRKAGSEDIDAMISLLQALFTIEQDFLADADHQRRGLLLLLSHPGQAAVFVAQVNGEVVGMVSAQVVVSTAVGAYSVLLEDMFVKTEHRRMGIGSKLLEQVVDWGVEKGAMRVQLVADETNTRALKFYRQAGLITGRMTALYGKMDVLNPKD